MRRSFATLVVLTLLLMGGAPSAGAAPQGHPRPVRAAGQAVGDAVTLFSTSGDEEGSFTVTDLTDDFQGTEEQPPRSERMVSLDVAIEANGGDVSVDPASFNIVDSTGVLWVDIAVTRTDDKESLLATDLADGDSVEGSVEIVIPSGVDIDKVIYIVDNERVLTLVDTTSGVGAGDVVDVYTTDGDEAGTIVADEAFDDVQDLAAGSEPGRGLVVYGVAVTVETTGVDPITVGPESFIAVDVNGTVYASDSTLQRTRASTRKYPDLESGDVAKGDTVSGFVGFVVGDEFPIDYVAFVPDARFYPVIDNVVVGDATPAANDDGKDDGTLGRTDKTPTSHGTTPTAGRKTPTAGRKTPTGAGGDCAGVGDWENDAVANVKEWGDVFSGLDTNNLDPDELRASADEVEKIADAQDASNPPDVAQALNDLLAQSYHDSADALNDLADAVEQGDDALVTKAAGTITDIGTSFQTGEVQDAIVALRGLCPDDVDQL